MCTTWGCGRHDRCLDNGQIGSRFGMKVLKSAGRQIGCYDTQFPPIPLIDLRGKILIIHAVDVRSLYI